MNAPEVRAALERVHAAAAALRAWTPRERLARLGDVLETWRDPASPPRETLAAELPGATGFSPAVVARGVALGHAPWTREALGALWEREAGPAARGFDTTSVLLAGAIPMPTVLALLAPLALGSGVLARPASRDPVTARVFAASLRARDQELGAALEVVEFDHRDDAALGAFLGAECVVATGSDETVAAIASRAAGTLVSRGHRLSVAVVGPDAPREGAADALALDVALWDQLGCLSPIAAYVLGSPADTRRFAGGLAGALERREQELPRGRVPDETAALLAHERADAEWRAAAGGGPELHRGTAWTVVAEPDARPRPAPLHRFVRVHPVADVGALRDALAPYARHLAAIGCAGIALPETYGAPRVCALGEMQAPPLSWPQDGIGVLTPLRRS